MTIDEAIEFYKGYNDRSGGTVDYNEFDEQIAEWLEELKVYQQHEIICRNGYNTGYNKAIDDFVNFANTMPTVKKEDGEIRPMWLEEIAKHLRMERKYV